MAVFENPANAHREEVSDLAGVWAFLFGFIWFVLNGLWGHALIQFFLIISCAVWPPFSIFMFFIWIGYALAAKSLLCHRYQRLGWREIKEGTSESGLTGATSEVDTMDCPYCAETIKMAARICRFCGREIGAEQRTMGLDDVQVMRKHDISFDGTFFVHKGFKFGNLNDAVESIVKWGK